MSRKKTKNNLYEKCNDIAPLQDYKNPDEYLAHKNHGSIPVRLRDHEFQLPDSELLNVLHYYVSHKYPRKQNIFDESALITLGMLMEQWMDEIMGETGQELFANVTSYEHAPQNWKRDAKSEPAEDSTTKRDRENAEPKDGQPKEKKRKKTTKKLNR